MVELEFHCCICGEQNTQCHFLSNQYDSDTIFTKCDYCKCSLYLETKTIHIVESVNEQ